VHGTRPDTFEDRLRRRQKDYKQYQINKLFFYDFEDGDDNYDSKHQRHHPVDA
jgi:hypothetical protein